ncbi:yemanuclein-like isoform X2 [Vanessa cardui]|uniref:yemanuclein-like isoform X2 n=1 Tax=Vanessa cardui TaxID=171605 RepID=UPI001F142336|nr:yemanuclein-like isoform X2 [Vanessa cardui]
MSDPKRATLITVGAPKSAKNNVNKSMRLFINLDESNESKYPELNYKELLLAAVNKERQLDNRLSLFSNLPISKTTGLDPHSDNDDDVERVARKFEQKYGGKSTYGRKGRSKYDEYADIGAGYDENDSFIDNTDGYDEMIPPGSDTLYGGFYINCGSLEFKAVPENQSAATERDSNRRNKRAHISSSSSEADSESLSDSDSQEPKDPKVITNGTVDSHETEHRKKKNKKIDKKKAKKKRRTDSSAATSCKHTSDDNAQGDAESADSRTSQSDSLTSKPAPSSENAITSDSSRDAEAKVDMKLPEAVTKVLEELEAFSQQSRDKPKDDNKTDQFINMLERALRTSGASGGAAAHARARAARALRLPSAALQPTAVPTTTTSEIAQSSTANTTTTITTTTTTTSSTTNNTTTTTTTSVTTTTNITNNKRKAEELLDNIDISKLTPDEREAKIVETLQRLKVLIEERKPGMMASYNAECTRVQEEKKKQAAPSADRRLPKRRFPWCARARALLVRAAALAGAPDAGAALLCARALPLFPAGFVRVPTLLRQANLSKDVKASDLKRQRVVPPAQSVITSTQFTEPIQFPSSLTVTTSVKSYEKPEEEKDSKYKVNPAAVFGSIMNSYTLNKDLVIETPEDRKKESDRSKEDSYIPNNIGSITITPVVNNQKDKKVNSTVNDKGKEPLIRVKSPAALNEMIHKKEKEKHKKPEKPAPPAREKSVQSPLHIDTNYQTKKSSPSPKTKDEITQKQIESMRIAENNIPRPGLVSVNHSPTFAKPDKRPPEVKKKKDIVIISDMDPLADVPQEPLAVDDSSSDVEVVEDKSDKIELKASENKSVTVPLKDKVSENHRKVNSLKQKSEKSVNSFRECRKEQLDEATKEDFDAVMRNLREMEHSQEPTKLNCNSYGGVITSAKREMSSKQKFSRPAIFGETRSDRDKFAE